MLVFLVAAAHAKMLPSEVWHAVACGQVVVREAFVPSSLTDALRRDAEVLHEAHAFRADGLYRTDQSAQGFDAARDRQTMRDVDWRSDRGDVDARRRFSGLIQSLRAEASRELRRNFPLENEAHELTYNWYEAGAALPRHLDEHHEDLKGRTGWALPTRRSLTWLVYLNDPRGGELRCYPRRDVRDDVGARDGDLQVGWHEDAPVFLGASKGLYTPSATLLQRAPGSVPELDDAKRHLRSLGLGFDLIARDPDAIERRREDAFDVAPRPGTLVLFDSVVVPHEVLRVESRRQAVTGWFHERLDDPLVPLLDDDGVEHVVQT
ncbi:hypothetical protein CTAYLR_002401 [Chrysophaeum taylorii]|uniref:Fe2OG dioxygenase domain-containing protein n=1 Tax=Chrysophaeum taylorii TaxID=2483200 RepID=A0AAD7XQL7_9STRA|nr:hypothetical protein CTAYLR_002401 [Chrysophaeum taylorii]